MDVTERMRAEGELLRKTAELQAIFMALPDLYLRVDKAGVIRDFHAAPNSEFAPYRRLLLFHTLAQVLPEATAEMLSAVKGHVLRAQRSARVDFQLRGQHYECRLIPFFGNEVVAVLRNISLSKRQDLLLRQSEERYRSVIDNVRELFFQTDAQGQFVFLSASWAEALGHSPESLQGQSLVQCLHSADRPLVEKLVQHLLAQQKGSFRAEVRVPTANGTLRWMDLQASCTRLPGSETYGLTGNLHDVTERKEAEKALVASKEEAERATRAKSEFLATVSHELRTPLNGIIGITELMRQTLLSADQEDLMETLRISSETLLQLINDLLDFSKIESGQLVLEHKPFAVHKLLQDCLELLRPKAGQHRVQVALYLDPRVPQQLEGDALRLRQVIFNLVDNAIKFSREGHVHISLYPLPTAEGAPPRLCLAVADDGIGIDPAKQAIIFEPFVQADTQTTRKFGGTGLGLAICQRIANLMGGRLWVHSTPQHGSTFFLSFPVSAPLQEVPATEPHRLLLWAAPGLPLGALKDYLEQVGHAVLTCQDTAQAQALLQQWQPHYVVVGYSVLAQAAQLPLPAPQQVLLWRDHSTGPQPTDMKALSAHPPLPWQLSGVWIARFLQDPASRWQSPYVSLRTLVPNAPQARGHVLVAEDNAINQKLVGRMLQHLGYTYTLVGDGQAVLDALSHRHYDLVLMDIQMPGMDGMETTRHLRQHLQLAIPVVAMTAHVLPGFEAACRAAGMTAYLPKPIRLEGLSEMLAKLLPLAFPRP
jgi:PAS domain S-box-containing protein